MSLSPLKHKAHGSRAVKGAKRSFYPLRRGFYVLSLFCDKLVREARENRFLNRFGAFKNKPKTAPKYAFQPYLEPVILNP